MNNAQISKCGSGKKGNLLSPCCPHTVWATGAVAPAAPVAPAPLVELEFHELKANYKINLQREWRHLLKPVELQANNSNHPRLNVMLKAADCMGGIQLPGK